jgi:hypothetical protein
VLQRIQILKDGILPLSMAVDIHVWWLISKNKNMKSTFVAVISFAFKQNILSIRYIFCAQTISAANFY